MVLMTSRRKLCLKSSKFREPLDMSHRRPLVSTRKPQSSCPYNWLQKRSQVGATSLTGCSLLRVQYIMIKIVNNYFMTLSTYSHSCHSNYRDYKHIRSLSTAQMSGYGSFTHEFYDFCLVRLFSCRLNAT